MNGGRPADWRRSVTVGLVAAGLLLRLGHYAANHPIWYDESVLLVNVLEKDYGRLLGPLDYEVAAPPLFLWLLRSVAVVFGDNPYAWRAVPCLAGCGTLLLTVPLARRLLAPGAVPLLTALVAFSDAHLWLGCNVKPYATDALVATGLLSAYAATDGWSAARRAWLFAAGAPVLLALSYPAAFLYGGLLLALAPWGRAARNGRAWVAWVGLACAVVGTFALLYFGPIRNQRVSGLVSGWHNHFPDPTRPALLPLWWLGQTFSVFHYCYNPVGGAGVLAAAVGVAALGRRGRLDLAAVL